MESYSHMTRHRKSSVSRIPSEDDDGTALRFARMGSLSAILLSCVVSLCWISDLHSDDAVVQRAAFECELGMQMVWVLSRLFKPWQGSESGPKRDEGGEPRKAALTASGT